MSDTQKILNITKTIDALLRNGRPTQSDEIIKELLETMRHLNLHKTNTTYSVLPNMLIAGPARTGTTWLKMTLGRHPDILMAKGEPNALWDIGCGKLNKAIEFYSRTDIWRGSIKTRALIAEKSPGYILLPDSDLEILAKLQPKLFIIFGKRNKIERLWSTVQHRMRAIKFSGTWQSFCEIHESEIIDHIKASDIEHHLERWKSKSPLWNINVVDFDKIATNGQEILESIFHLVGVRPISQLSAREQLKIVNKITENPNLNQKSPIPDTFREMFS